MVFSLEIDYFGNLAVIETMPTTYEAIDTDRPTLLRPQTGNPPKCFRNLDRLLLPVHAEATQIHLRIK